MSVQDVETLIMELRAVHSARRSTALTLLHANAWHEALQKTGLLCKYHNLAQSIQDGFHTSIPTFCHTFSPPNKVTSEEHQLAFSTIVEKELHTKRWLGPYPQHVIEAVLGPFQMLPISMVPKAGKPGKFQLVQNFSYSYKPLPLPLLSKTTIYITTTPSAGAINTYNITSINSSIDSILYLCLWGTFANTCRLLWTVPPGSQRAVQDVSEAYCMILP
ncbi:reverse transcriptase ribonuclease h [Moniliophthora roreri MCA 2997]|nr:reverse transcriptase ribonuclease h [Moniliophthora roreri MCA 2997]